MHTRLMCIDEPVSVFPFTVLHHLLIFVFHFNWLLVTCDLYDTLTYRVE